MSLTMNPLDYRVPDPAESRTARRRILFWIAIGAVAVIVAIVIGVVITIAVISRRLDEHYSKAENYVAGAKLMLAKDPRFQHVELDATTQLGGAVRADGTVGTSSDLSALQRALQAIASPVPILNHVQVVASTTPSIVPTSGSR